LRLSLFEKFDAVIYCVFNMVISAINNWRSCSFCLGLK